MEKHLLKQFNKFFEENNIRRYEDLPNAGAYIVFNDLKDKVKCYNKFQELNMVNPCKRLLCCCRK